MKKEKQPYFLVIGLGTSGTSMAKFLCSKGKTVIATDIDASRKKIAEELNALGIETQIGFHDQKTFNLADVIVPSPGISKNNTFIKTAVSLGVNVEGELDIFSRYNNLPVIAITGTNGKTTTTTLIGDILKSCGMKPFVGGNIGTPLVDHLINKGATDVIVAEISSFQLDLSTRFRPDVGVLLNISEDHLDRYEDPQAYETSKWSIFKHQRFSDKAVINESIKNFNIMSKKLESRIFTFSSEDTLINCNAKISSKTIKIITQELTHIVKTNQLKELKGAHNRENIAAALLACLAIGVDINKAVKGLETFKNLPHRMEFIKTIDKVSFYNDSKGTNTDAVIQAIKCFGKNIILILGGREKGTNFSLLINDIQKSVKIIIALGECRALIKDTFKNICPVLEVLTMNEAVQTAFDKASQNDAGEPAIVLLSPACASFDMYEDYVHRGNDFTTLVNALGDK
ncbi:MAG: UDP-N-acetylmuramoyl-L-alanine--D-glutamate ligase [Desulfobacula sp.]|uniref:UDP-N-acetylmuramoyl-L-alanine--D-glutamate ligase n=1 Tax=Desulfobacula sp. TaxID=2593537 RepID=UPI001E11CD25|nr:UDP-N-acetylmuramoyl-L-alanine--D-glutamate ligase [Desulfobacula sp.]MBT3483817.1 UDP-N-acetylmuramoyl-L-alanine--D-glutamate ligase [Desulfobacula sp.]MBT3803005.1 UDP-N-acetylmuramoyl-L-alanine--D-glutamate ligase [Desulfobacula sp.]MBT4023482.1 UDP-N-acetylmuramoyl-L-alanine--D-glutamate ligase [Desulfobacula sp.]MBT4197053.1 UDP-N-acetylmuramoyl-L-alanine--D-glutamate ligase [Desulfobacula sp.]